MPRLPVLAAALLLGCANAATPYGAPPTAGLTRTVTGISMRVGGDLPSRYRRTGDGPGAKFVLWSYERICVVDASTWVQTRVGDSVSCDWRAPR
ncbi:MAG: hypothetical protein ACREMN_01780 [Gemmatimonadales bacterium]